MGVCNKAEKFLLAEKLFVLTWKIALIVTCVGLGITNYVSDNGEQD